MTSVSDLKLELDRLLGVITIIRQGYVAYLVVAIIAYLVYRVIRSPRFPPFPLE